LHWDSLRVADKDEAAGAADAIACASPIRHWLKDWLPRATMM